MDLLELKNKDDHFYPKVLIVAQSYSIIEGIGITLNNLFDQWPIDRFAIAAENILIHKDVKWESYYQLGTKEIHSNIKNKISGVKSKDDILIECNNYNNNTSTRDVFSLKKRIFKKILRLLGSDIFLTTKIEISDAFKNYINDFKPDIVYIVPTSPIICSLSLDIRKSLETKMTVHFMDDYQKRFPPSLLYYYFEYRNNNLYKKFVESADLHFSISDEMAIAYNKRFKKDFHTFHNPVNIEIMSIHLNNAKNDENKIRILQVGNISSWRADAISDICWAITSLNLKSEKKIEFDIYAQNRYSNSNLFKRYAKFDAVKIKEPLKHAEILKKISSYDLIVLACNFDKKAIKYVHLSYSTNTSEFMASGVPILCYGPEKVKFISDAKKHRWAHVVSIPDVEKLESDINDILTNTELREQLINNALKIVNERSEIKMTQDKMHRLLLDIVS